MSRWNSGVQKCVQGVSELQYGAIPAKNHGRHQTRHSHSDSKDTRLGGLVEKGIHSQHSSKQMGLGPSHSKPDPNQQRAQTAQQRRKVNPTYDFPFLQDEKSIQYINGSKVMFILRGLTGSGKTTLADAIRAKYGRVLICSADNFFVSNGVYQFESYRLPEAHDWCKRQAQRFCENNRHNVIVVDNTNIQLWEFEHYLEVAKVNNFVVLVVEPKTSWRRDVAQLEKKTVHGISAGAIKKKMNTFEDVCPEYFGWFFNEADTQMLHSIAQAYLDEISANAEFKSDFTKWAGKYFRDLKEYFFNSSFDETRQVFHCTAHYIGSDCSTDEYLRRKAVVNSTGKVYTLRVVGFVITPRTFGARVLLDNDTLTLWNQNDTQGGPGGCDDLVKSMGQLQLQNDKAAVGNSKKRNSGCPLTIPTLHWTKRVQYEKRYSPTSGRGSRAHLTLGCSRDAQPVETGFDLVNVIHCEKRMNNTPPNLFFHVHEGVAGTYGNGQWVVYLNKQIEVKALFTGSF